MMQMTGLILQLEYSARILLAAVCGACIGYERTNRLKTAGIRTHVIVSLAAALMMIISKYSVIFSPSTTLDWTRQGLRQVS